VWENSRKGRFVPTRIFEDVYGNSAEVI